MKPRHRNITGDALPYTIHECKPFPSEFHKTGTVPGAEYIEWEVKIRYSTVQMDQAIVRVWTNHKSSVKVCLTAQSHNNRVWEFTTPRVLCDRVELVRYARMMKVIDELTHEVDDSGWEGLSQRIAVGVRKS
jgi:hypothetical protein